MSRYKATILVRNATGTPVTNAKDGLPVTFDPSALFHPIPESVPAKRDHIHDGVGYWEVITDATGELTATLETASPIIDDLIDRRGYRYASIGARVYAYRSTDTCHVIKRADLKEISIVRVPGFPGTELAKIGE